MPYIRCSEETVHMHFRGCIPNNDEIFSLKIPETGEIPKKSEKAANK